MGNCRLVRDGQSADARWQRQGELLLLTPGAGPTVVVALGEVAGIGGDGFSISLRAAPGDITLERLGGDGPSLLQELRRDWPPLRAGVLRLSDGGPPDQVFAGSIAGSIAGATPGGPFRGFLQADRLIVATEGGDVRALFLADYRSLAFDEATYAVVCQGWAGEELRFSKLGGETTAFRAALQAARDALAGDAAATLARYLPTLAPTARIELAAQWLPGRVLSFAALESLAPGFEAAFATSWLTAGPRAESGRKLIAGCGPAERWLGYAAASRDEAPMLWLLVGSGGQWSLELLSHGDYATYLFAGGDEVPGLVSGIVRLPEFSREALYLPLAEMTGDRAKYAIPARDLPLLAELRRRFAGRRIHAAAG